MKIDLPTVIAMPPDEIWRRVLTPELLIYIASPLVRFQMVNGNFPTEWTEGERFQTSLCLFGVVPFGTQWIVPSVQVSDPAAWPKRLRDNGSSALIETWDHWITIEPDGNGETLYRDTVEVKAGLLTPFVWAFAQTFYRHRQRRWRKLAHSASDRKKPHQ